MMDETKLEVCALTFMRDKTLDEFSALPETDSGHIFALVDSRTLPPGWPMLRSLICPFPPTLA